MPNLKTLPYDKYSEQLSEACAWAASLGIRYSPTRLGRYEKLWRDLADCARRKELNEFFDAVPFPTFLNAAYETTEIVEVYRGLKELTDTAMTERLRETFKGHDLYVMDQSNRSGRDFGFELYVASKFTLCGLKVNFSSAADVEVEYRDRMLFVECKRLKSLGKVKARVKEGLDQLEKRYAAAVNPSKTDGILALSLSKLLNPGLGMLNAKTVRGVSDIAGRHIDKFASDFGVQWQQRTGSNHLGVVMFLDSPCEVTGKRLFLTSQEVAINNIAARGTSEFNRLLEISERVFA